MSASAETAQSEDMRPALFLDRDGVINVDRGYVARQEDFEFMPGAAQAIARFNARNWRVFVITNQTGVAFDLYSEEDMHKLHDYMLAELAARGAHIDAIYHCLYHEDGKNERFRKESELRKPRPGMLLQAMKDFPTDTRLSFMVGDKVSDIEAAENAGIRGFLFKTGDVDAFIEGTWHTMMMRR